MHVKPTKHRKYLNFANSENYLKEKYSDGMKMQTIKESEVFVK